MNNNPMNILVIMCDQLRYDAISSNGNPYVKTPNLDRLAKKSVNFTSAYTTSPLCAPVRYTMATGLLPYNHGVIDNHKMHIPGIRTIAHVLGEKGYASSNMGHMHWNDEDLWDTGYDERLARDIDVTKFTKRELTRLNWELSSPLDSYVGGPGTMGKERYWSWFTKNEAVRKLREYKEGDKPFLCWCSFHEPHPPFYAPRDLYESIDKDSLPLPKMPPVDAPPAHPSVQEKTKAFAHLTNYEHRQYKGAYYALTQMVDEFVGDVLNTLDELDLWKDTMVLFTIDHGDQMGDHGLYSKFVFREASVHAPFMVYHPDYTPGVRDQFVLHSDVFPTLCDFAGAEIPDYCQGSSLRALLEKDETPQGWRKHAVSTNSTNFMYRTKKWKLNMFAGEPGELYDMENDPDEFYNLINGEKYKDIVAELEAAFHETYPGALEKSVHIDTHGPVRRPKRKIKYDV